MRFSVLIPLTALLSMAAGQDPDNPDNMSPCLLVCNEQAATAAGCVTYLDTDCTCPKQVFVDTLKRCLAAACTPEDEERSKELHFKHCQGPLD